MLKIFKDHPGTLVGVLLGVGLLGTFWVSLSSSTFIAHESSILRLPLLSWGRNVPTIFSRDFLMFSDGQFRPLSYALIAVVRTFVGADNVLFWHLWLLAFHTLNTILVFVLVRHFSEHVWSAGLSAVIFGFHPLSAVVVHNINYFHYVFGLTLYLATFYCYLSYVRTSRKRTYVGAMVWFVLGVFASKVMFALPFILVAYEVLYRRSGLRTTLARLLPFAAVSLLVFPLYWFYKPHPLQYKYIEFPAGSGWYSFLSVVGATGWYAKGLLLGWELPAVLHEVVEQIFRFFHWKVLVWGMVDLGILLGGGWVLWRKRWAGLGIFLLFGALLPFASTSWNGVEEYVSWTYLYVPLVGWAFLVGGIADGLWAFRRKVRVGAAAMLCLIGVYYGVQQVRLHLVFRSALGYWSRVVELDPNSEVATLELGKAYLERGEREEALRFLFSPVRTGLRAPCLAMSRTYGEEGDLLAAAIHLGMVGEKEDGLLLQEYEMASSQIFYAAGAPDHAEAALGRNLIANPYNVAAMERLAEIWLLKGYFKAARRLLDRALELGPSHPAVARMRARLRPEGLKPEGLAAYRNAPASEAPQVVHPPDPNWLRYVLEGVSDLRLREEIVRTSERHRADPVVQMEAGVSLLKDGRFPQALSKLRVATEMLSSSAYAWAMRCWAASEAGAYREAEEAGRRAQELDPQSPTVQNVLGILYSTLRGDPRDPAYRRRLERAIAHYQRALQLNPRDAAAHSNLGDVLKRAGRIEEAMEHFRQAVRIQPSLAEPHYNLANLLSAQGKLEEAIEHYRQALRARKDFVEAHNNLGVALLKVGRIEEAIEHFRRALLLKPDSVRARDNLKMALSMRRR